ncbi:hypothetical protein OMP38_08220 [Cohnella ginsengisoli]|uniref:Uncharacterized protein n=1 Tax=Cohnella ginsengisoli TaxID=425004 RepID=A0A9X4QLV5_9BACL|nr:hypothetical protein [Cohnella ginsengisoli]MDG0790850.1 hypothetical protein [Cohnella ginsengisoli]
MPAPILPSAWIVFVVSLTVSPLAASERSLTSASAGPPSLIRSMTFASTSASALTVASTSPYTTSPTAGPLSSFVTGMPCQTALPGSMAR